jgi:hypothetical protein
VIPGDDSEAGEERVDGVNEALIERLDTDL